MHNRVQMEQCQYPSIRVFTFSDFSLERLKLASANATSYPPSYVRVAEDEWSHRGPAMSLLKVLLCSEGRRASRRELIQSIWPEHAQIKASHALDSAASVLRRILRLQTTGSFLLTVREGSENSFKLPVQHQFWVDADAFLALSSHALLIEAQGQNPLSVLEQAHALIKGTFLEDEQQQNWSRKRRNTINGARHRVLFKLVECYLREQRIHQAEELLFAFLEQQPTNEDALCQLMSLLAQQGRRQEALHIYTYVMDVLHEEQLSPTQFSQELARRIRYGLAVQERRTLYRTHHIHTLRLMQEQSQYRYRSYAQSRNGRNSLKLMETIFQATLLKYSGCLLEGNRMHMDIYKIYYENYSFSVELDTGSTTGAYQLTVWFAEKISDKTFGEWRFLRNFYFEEANEHDIRDFCHKFATDDDYRQEVVAEQAPWFQRNALFERNLLSVVGESLLLSNNGDYYLRARDFFRWVDQHYAEIIALPEYQFLLEQDRLEHHTISKPGMTIDPAINPAVEILGQIPGVSTQFSCQGVSGKVFYEDYQLMTVSAHEEYAYVSFMPLGQTAHDAIVDHLPNYPHITTQRIPCNFALNLVLRSTGDNLNFREELLSLAYSVFKQADDRWNRQAEERKATHWQESNYPQRNPHINSPGGILPSRLDWLCQPEQIERTLQLLFHLNHWAKAREQLLYADRQGLYALKQALLDRAYQLGTIQPLTYIDGTNAFAADYNCEFAVDLATELFVDRLPLLLENGCHTMGEEEAALQLFQRITGKAAPTAADIEALDLMTVGRYIQTYVQHLIQQARASRQPLSPSELAALFIDPIDFLNIEVSRSRIWLNWDELNASDLRKLDPEGWSLIAFEYTSETAHYTFHLPFRSAESFLAAPVIEELRSKPGQSREYGSYYGVEINKDESQSYPLEAILYELMVDISTICPYKLIAKEDYLAQKTNARQDEWELAND